MFHSPPLLTLGQNAVWIRSHTGQWWLTETSQPLLGIEPLSFVAIHITD